MPIKHLFASGKADGADATLVRPSNWNADHQVVGGGPWLAAVTSTVTVSNTLTETTLASYTILANTAQVGDTYRLTAWGRMLTNAGVDQNSTWRLKLGATTMHNTGARNYSQNGTQRAWLARWTLVITGASAQQGFAEMYGTATGWDGGGWAPIGTGETFIGWSLGGAEAMSANKAMVLTVQHGVANTLHQVDCRGALFERIAA